MKYVSLRLIDITVRVSRLCLSSRLSKVANERVSHPGSQVILLLCVS